jgi:hypothetical protein
MFRDAAANATTGGGDDGGFAVELHGHEPRLSSGFAVLKFQATSAI